MVEYWKQTTSGGTADRPPQPEAAQASAPVAQRATLPEPVFVFPRHSIIPIFQYSR